MRQALVVGAGIAGPALAFWLDRFGFATTVVEKAPALRPGGQAVDLRGVAREAAARMGLDERIRAASVRTRGFTTVDARGTPLSSVRAGMGWEVPWLLDRMDEASDFWFDSCSQVRLDEWSRGRVGLLGDAAFCPSPLSGQGTSLAVVGAYVLAGELAAAGDDVPAGLAAYERRMRDWVLATQRLATDGTGALPAVANAFELPDY